MGVYDQAEFDIRCEWGLPGVEQLAPGSACPAGSARPQGSDAVIIVDVLSFSTCVSIATARGALVYPYRGKAEEAQAFADARGAELAGRRSQDRISLSPASLLNLPAGTRFVLPSLNGSTLSLAAADLLPGGAIFAGCLRNAAGVAKAARAAGPRIAVIPAGERWKHDQSLRPALEDLIGAGAILHYLLAPANPGGASPSMSPEARLAVAAFEAALDSGLPRVLETCSSGKELIEAGYDEDVHLAALLDADECAPLLVDGVYRYQAVL